MSLSMRPVREEWGEHTDLFLDHDDVLNLLGEIARAAGTPSSRLDWYGDTENVRIADGKKFLDFVASDAFSPQWANDNLTGFDEGGFETGPDWEDISALIANMKTLASQWRESIGSSGEIVFYVD